jgi:hypothetical protein
MTQPTKLEIRFFVSYAHDNERLAKSFLNKFERVIKPSKKYRYCIWQDQYILPGEKWTEEIKQAIKNCHLGLLLISPDFLSSEFIGDQELPEFVGNEAKPMVPVMLLKVNLKRHDLKGLKDFQIFRLRRSGFRTPKAYSQCSSSQRNDFIDELFEAVEARLDKLKLN